MATVHCVFLYPGYCWIAASIISLATTMVSKADISKMQPCRGNKSPAQGERVVAIKLCYW